jgi:hypothetical protein
MAAKKGPRKLYRYSAEFKLNAVVRHQETQKRETSRWVSVRRDTV